MTAKMLVLVLIASSLITLFAVTAVGVRRDYVRLRERARRWSSAGSVMAARRRQLISATDPAVDVTFDWSEWDRVNILAPLAVSEYDRGYYRTCWQHILGTFEHWPVIALDLAETLTANLMINRQLAIADAGSAAHLPDDWRFPAAQGYRVAQSIARRAQRTGSPQGGDMPRAELSKALLLYRALFEEVLAAPALAEVEAGAGAGAETGAQDGQAAPSGLDS